MAVLLFPFFMVPLAHAFSFTIASAPTQCSNFTLEWSGGTPPYEITILPIISLSTNTTPHYPYTPILDTNTSSTSWSQQLLLPAGANFTMVLSDAKGFGTGGSSEILTVGNGSSSCLPTTAPHQAFGFAILFTTGQCGSFQFEYFEGSFELPIIVSAVIPGEKSWEFPPIMDASLNPIWTTDVEAGTEIGFLVGDSRGRATAMPGAMALFTIVPSNDTSCLSDKNSPQTWDPPISSSGPSHTGAIVGGVIGGVAGLLLLIFLLWLLRRRLRLRSVMQTHPLLGGNRN